MTKSEALSGGQYTSLADVGTGGKRSASLGKQIKQAIAWRALPRHSFVSNCQLRR